MKKNAEFMNLIDRNVLRILSVAVMLTFMIPVITKAQAGKTNFSGTWTFNESKSNMGEGRGFRARQLTVKQDGINLAIDRLRTTPNGDDVTSNEKYTTDGKECVNSMGRGQAKSVVTWVTGGKALNFATTRTFERDGETMTMKSTEVWTLTDAKTLSIATTANTPNGEMKATLVYDKK
jgi:hypothetical protein